MEYNKVNEAGEKSFQPQAFSYRDVRLNNPSLGKVSKREFMNRPNLQKEILGYRIDGKEDYNENTQLESEFDPELLVDDYSFPTDSQELPNQEINQFSEGGHIDKKESKDELIEFEGGGTHDENPNGGIPIGFGSNGKQNKVEEGETRFSFAGQDYIFSNRISL